MRRRLAPARADLLLRHSPQALALGLIVLAIVGVTLNSELGSNWLVARLSWGRQPAVEAGRAPAPSGLLLVDWPAVTQEATAQLQTYLRFDTGRHGGQMEQAAQWLHGVLRQAGIESHLISGASGRLGVLARLPGYAGAHPLILYSHIDVPPPDPDRWSIPPFDGAVRDGYVYGAGALDPKGQTIVDLMTMLALKRASVPLQRDVVLLAVGSEQDLAQPNSPFLLQVGQPEAEYLLGAGGGVLEVRPGQRAWMVCTSAKGSLTIRVGPARPDLGQSEGLLGSASEQLVQAIQRLLAWQAPLAETSGTSEFFGRLARRYPFPVGSLLAQPWAWSKLIAPEVLQSPVASARVRDTISLVRLEPWPDDPLRPSAVLQVRSMPGRTRYQILAELQVVAGDPDLRFEVLEEVEGQESDWSTPLFRAIERVAADEAPGAAVLPTGGVSDGSRYFRQRGVICYGFLPFDLDAGELEHVGQADERLAVTNLQVGLRRMLEVVLDLCAGQPTVVMNRS